MAGQRAGYDSDPYDSAEERKEIFPNYHGPFSTFREIHIGIRGFYAGLRAGELS
jgi:hypothetical protein